MSDSTTSLKLLQTDLLFVFAIFVIAACVYRHTIQVQVVLVLYSCTMQKWDDLSSDTDSLGYSTEQVIEIQDEIQETFDKILKSVKCKKVLNIVPDMFQNKSKDKVISWLVDVLDTLRRSRNLLRDAAGEIDVLQKEAIKDKSLIIKLQDEVIEENKTQFQSVQSAVKSEIKSYRDAVSTQISEPITIEAV